MHSLQPETHGKAMCLNEKSGQICFKMRQNMGEKSPIEMKGERILSLEEATF
jgi:hypothetical protein